MSFKKFNYNFAALPSTFQNNFALQIKQIHVVDITGQNVTLGVANRPLKGSWTLSVINVLLQCITVTEMPLVWLKTNLSMSRPRRSQNASRSKTRPRPSKKWSGDQDQPLVVQEIRGNVLLVSFTWCFTCQQAYGRQQEKKEAK